MTPRNKLYIFVIFLSITGYTWVFWNVHQFQTHTTSLSPCLFKNITGIPCPSCGTTHSVTSIMKGNFREAMNENPLGFLVSLMLILFPFWVVFDLLFRKTTFFNFYRKVEYFLRKKWVAYPAIILLLINWIINIHKSL